MYRSKGDWKRQVKSTGTNKVTIFCTRVVIVYH